MDNKDMDKAVVFLEDLLNGNNSDIVFETILNIREKNKIRSSKAVLNV